MSGHFIVKCECGEVITQCRCFSADKRIIIGKCDECLRKDGPLGGKGLCEHGQLARKCEHCEINQQDAEISRLKAKLRMAREVLQRVEWRGAWCDPVCPYCGDSKKSGHGYCQLARVLKELEEE